MEKASWWVDIERDYETGYVSDAIPVITSIVEIKHVV